MNGLSRLGTIIAVNVRHFFMSALIVTGIFQMFLLYQFGLFQLNERTVHAIYANFLPLLGILWMTSVQMPEGNKDIEDVVSVRKTAHWHVLLLRLVLGALFIVAAILLYSVILQWNSTTINSLIIGAAIANALFLGSIGCIVQAWTRQSTVSLMIPVLFYMLNYFVPNALGVLYLFDLEAARWWMIALTILLYGMTLWRKR